MAWREPQSYTKDVSDNSLQPSISEIKHELCRSFTTREAEISVCSIDPYMFPSKQKSIKNMFSSENVKVVRKAISKFFLYNAISFNIADSGPYYQAMSNTIAKADPSVKGPTVYRLATIFGGSERS